ncbi:MAG: TVP38/TMEM64 family protein [Holophagales bacterium]|nr:TVP38/TMEM64 family protein [Holophagales bacterium]
MSIEAEVETGRARGPESEPAPAADATTPKGRWWRPLVALAVVVALVLLLRHLGPAAAEPVRRFLGWVDSLGIWAPVVFVLGYAVATVAFVPGSLLTMAGGILFGLAGGTGYVFLGATLGSGAAFLIARYLARSAIERRLEGNERFSLIDEAVGREGLKIVFLLRLVPFFPFIWLNYGLGLTRVRFRDYLLGGVGMLPGTFLYVFYGKAIGSLAALAQGGTVERGAEQWIFLGLGLVAAILVTTLITREARKALARATVSEVTSPEADHKTTDARAASA